jgi:hypothetical protein
MAPGPSGHIGYHTKLSSPQRPCLKLCGCRPGRCLLRCTECSSSTMPFYSRLPPSRLHKLSLFAQPLPPDITAGKPPVGLGEICSPLVRPSFESSRDPGNSETGALGTRENPRRGCKQSPRIRQTLPLVPAMSVSSRRVRFLSTKS